MYKIKLEQFEGPFDLLLQLIEEEKLDITKLSLADVTEQYLEYLSRAEGLNPGELADFLVVAAKLLLIKSRILLPELAFEEEEEGDLESQLKIYREFYEASIRLHKMILKKKFAYQREKPLKSLEPVFSPPKRLTRDKLALIFKEILKGLAPIIELPREIIAKTISIQEKIRNIKEMILKSPYLNFKTILERSRTKTEIVVTFLALLELVKQREIVVVQEGIFEEITIKKQDHES